MTVFWNADNLIRRHFCQLQWFVNDEGRSWPTPDRICVWSMFVSEFPMTWTRKQVKPKMTSLALHLKSHSMISQSNKHQFSQTKITVALLELQVLFWYFFVTNLVLQLLLTASFKNVNKASNKIKLQESGLRKVFGKM